MREPWNTLLARSAETVVTALATPDEMEMALGDSGVICPLPSLGMLHVAGDDAVAFLQKQLSQDVAGLDGSRSTLAAWCNAKGRTRAVFRVIPSDTGLILLADAELLEAIRPTLQMFILRSQVALTDLAPEEGALGMAGPAAVSLLTEGAGSLPDSPGGVVRAGDLHVVALPGAVTTRYLVIAPTDQLAAFWGRYRDALTEGNEDFWHLQAIRAGLPDLTLPVSESLVPTMLNLEPLGGISYEKGCYPGQEVVARMHYRGQLKRRLYRAALAGDPPAAGTAVEDNEGTEAGVVINAAPASGGGSELLAVLRIEKADSDLRVETRSLQLLDLPYAPPH
ncbi:YgfZ/GcvT domain-containing protein [Spiribacter vilamensis]|uniref:Uncharacterized protein n=1 Tax=Spiribacter vilamensis TaxID=531306 RepID=A0A4V2GIX8_9GAMM|nr:folate-binding protein YgfZ [Spiribacter vilamensis]RZU98175.1 hypothetical protein EV698_0416 [Spiribacter vilamensis]TVO60925.1 folate-binding protein YgfZ [Spiribacter vilamensis]